MIPPTNGDILSNYNDGYTFYFAKEVVLFVKTYIESMLDESDFGAATEMGEFALDKGPKVSLAP